MKGEWQVPGGTVIGLVADEEPKKETPEQAPAEVKPKKTAKK